MLQPPATGLDRGEQLVVPSDYRIVDGPPSIPDYLDAALARRTRVRDRKQAEIAIGGAWTAVHIVETKSEACVGMGRVIGDGGWCFHIIDMAVLPMHQHLGLGEAILRALLERIRADAPSAFVSLLADSPGIRLYRRHGFAPTAPTSIGMAINP